MAHALASSLKWGGGVKSEAIFEAFEGNENSFNFLEKQETFERRSLKTQSLIVWVEEDSTKRFD